MEQHFGRLRCERIKENRKAQTVFGDSVKWAQNHFWRLRVRASKESAESAEVEQEKLTITFTSRVSNTHHNTQGTHLMDVNHGRRQTALPQLC